jgi:hypothetical protein
MRRRWVGRPFIRATVAFITVDEYGLQGAGDRTLAWEIRWDDLVTVAVRATIPDRFGDHAYLLLTDRYERQVTVPLPNTPQDVVERLAALPGFDRASFDEAIHRTDEALVVCWRQKPPLRDHA